MADAAGAHLDDEVRASSGVARSTVSGTPISLLRLPAVATVGPAAAEHLGEVVLGAGLALGAGERR